MKNIMQNPYNKIFDEPIDKITLISISEPQVLSKQLPHLKLKLSSQGEIPQGMTLNSTIYLLPDEMDDGCVPQDPLTMPKLHHNMQRSIDGQGEENNHIITFSNIVYMFDSQGNQCDLSDRIKNIQDIGANVALNAYTPDKKFKVKSRTDILIPMIQFEDYSDGNILQFVLQAARDHFQDDLFKCKDYGNISNQNQTNDKDDKSSDDKVKDNVCQTCNESFKLLNNTCVSSCPPTTQTCVIQQASFCYDKDAIEKLNIDLTKCGKSEQPIDTKGIDSSYNVRGIITFPVIEKKVKPKYYLIMNPLDPSSSRLLRKWYKVQQLMKNDTNFYIVFQTMDLSPIDDGDQQQEFCQNEGKNCQLPSTNVKGFKQLDSQIYQNCYIQKKGINNWFDLIIKIIDENEKTLSEQIPDFTKYVNDEDNQFITKCYNNSFSNINNKLNSTNSYLQNNLLKLKKLGSEQEPEVVIEETKLKGNIDDIKDIFMNICNAMKTPMPQCRINVNSKIWRYDQMVQDEEERQFVQIEDKLSYISIIGISMVIVLIILLLMGLLQYGWYKYRIKQIIKDHVLIKVNQQQQMND